MNDVFINWKTGTAAALILFSAAPDLAAREGRIEIAGLPCTITNPGCYYLSANFPTSVGTGTMINVQADDVTVDLNGFTIHGLTSNGVFQGSGYRNLTVQNGVVIGCGGAEAECAGIMAMGQGNVIRNIRASENGYYGIYAGPNASILDCTASSNLMQGIHADSYSTIQRCTALGNGDAGIDANSGCIVSDCAAIGNGWNGISIGNGGSIIGCTCTTNGGYGIHTGGGSIVIKCAVMANRYNGIQVYYGSMVSRCATRKNGENGVYAESYSSVMECLSSDNGEDGVNVEAGCFVRDCQALNNNNGIALAGTNNYVRANHCDDNRTAGLSVPTKANLIYENHAVDNAYGFRVIVSNNLVFRNSARSNGTTNNFLISAGNIAGPVITTNAATIYPFANFIF